MKQLDNAGKKAADVKKAAADKRGDDSDDDAVDEELDDRMRKLDKLRNLVADEVDMAIKDRMGQPQSEEAVRGNLLDQKAVIEDLLGPRHGPKLDGDTKQMLEGQLGHVNRRLKPKSKKKDAKEDDGAKSEDDWIAAGDVDNDATGTAGGMAPNCDFQMARSRKLTAPSRLASPLVIDAPLLTPKPRCRERKSAPSTSWIWCSGWRSVSRSPPHAQRRWTSGDAA